MLTGSYQDEYPGGDLGHSEQESSKTANEKCAETDFLTCFQTLLRTKIPSGFLGLFHSTGLCSLGPECGFETLTSLPGEGGNLDFRNYSSLSFHFHSLLCSVLVTVWEWKPF